MPTQGEVLWELLDVTKSFPGVRALDRVAVTLRQGEIHALVGENGSGKSTLAKCLAGVHLPDRGALFYQGEQVDLRSPVAARQRGVAVFYQESSIVRTLSVAENIHLGRLPGRGPLVDWRRAREGARQALRRLGIDIDPDRLVGGLSVAEQQLVEIAKALSSEMSLLILDEPTAALGPGEIDRLHEVIRLLSNHGTSMLYISHRLEEVFGVADVITVIRDGRIVNTQRRAETTIGEIVRQMIGADVEDHFLREGERREGTRLEADHISTARGVHNVTFAVAPGEILGLGGVIGSGRTEIARALFGLDPLTSGEVRVDGRRIDLRSPARAIQAGVAFLPEDRKAEGLFTNWPGIPNITVANLAAVSRGPLLRLAAERRRGGELIDDLRIDPRARSSLVPFLSGGNQQKLMLARWLFCEAKVLILDEPTQGIDVGAKAEVYRVLNELTAMEISIILISSDYPELLGISDRVAVIRDGTVVHIADRGDISEHDLVELATTTTRKGA
jgi:ribose transport system ATP-binding protein